MENWLKWLWKMTAISSTREGKLFWNHHHVGGWLMHLNIVLVLEKSLWLRIYWIAKNNYSTCFAPKTDLNGIRKMPTISHLWGIKKLWENQFVGGLFIHLSIYWFLKKNLWSRRYFSLKSPIQPVLHPDRKMLCIGRIGWVLKNVLSNLGKIPYISSLRGGKLLCKDHHAVGWLTCFTIDSILINSLWWILYWHAKTAFWHVLHLNKA